MVEDKDVEIPSSKSGLAEGGLSGTSGIPSFVATCEGDVSRGVVASLSLEISCPVGGIAISL